MGFGNVHTKAASEAKAIVFSDHAKEFADAVKQVLGSSIRLNEG